MLGIPGTDSKFRPLMVHYRLPRNVLKRRKRLRKSSCQRRCSICRADRLGLCLSSRTRHSSPPLFDCVLGSEEKRRGGVMQGNCRCRRKALQRPGQSPGSPAFLKRHVATMTALARVRGKLNSLRNVSSSETSGLKRGGVRIFNARSAYECTTLTTAQWSS